MKLYNFNMWKSCLLICPAISWKYYETILTNNLLTSRVKRNKERKKWEPKTVSLPKNGWFVEYLASEYNRTPRVIARTFAAGFFSPIWHCSIRLKYRLIPAWVGSMLVLDVLALIRWITEQKKSHHWCRNCCRHSIRVWNWIRSR